MPHQQDFIHQARRMLVMAGISFMLALFGMSLVYLHATLFDHRFAYGVTGTCILGLATGTAINRWFEKQPRERVNRIPWLALMGLLATITVSLFFAFSVVAIGATSAFLLFVMLSVFPFAFWSIGRAAWLHEQHISGSQPLLASMAGALAGVIASFPLVEHLQGPLFTVWLAAAGLVVLTLFARREAVAMTLAGLSAILLLSAGLLSAWDFTLPPRWSGNASLGQSLYTNDSRDNSLTRVITRWNGLVRTDMVYDKNISNLAPIFRNGMLSGALPIGPSGKAHPEQLKRYFPLIALAQAAGHARDILVINSNGGLIIKMAADSGITRPHSMESSPALKFTMEQRQNLSEYLLDNPDIKLDYGNIRHGLRNDATKYDQIYLPIPTVEIPGGVEPEFSENYLYTREAFRNYWARLKSGGMLIILANEEMLYMRALLLAWETLDEHRAGGNALLGRQAWGYRMTTLMPPIKPHHYLLMLAKGPIDGETAGRIEQLAQGMMVEKLFGPGMLPPAAAFSIYDHPYYILYHPKGPAVARNALSEYMSWHLKTRASMNIPTNRHPNFFQITADMHADQKWLVAICSVLLIYIYLFPLNAERLLDRPANNNCPPLPVYLTYHVSLSAGLMMSLVAVANQATLFTERTSGTLTTVFAAVLLGAGTAFRYGRVDDTRHRGWMAAVAAVVFCGSCYWFLVNGWEIAGEWPVSGQLGAVAVMAFLPGLFTMQLLRHGLGHLRRNLPALVPWALVAYGLATPLGAIAAFWICRAWGWDAVWMTVTGCYFVVIGTGLYIRWATVQGQMKYISAQ